MSKKLVAYFSASGVTKKAAQYLAAAANADIFEIKPTALYTKADLDWTNKKSRSSLEMSDMNNRPEIAERVENMESYDTVFIGFPIWWYTAPNIIRTFLESYDFSNKKIALFATSGGSGLAKTADSLKPLCSDSAKWLEGKMMNRINEAELEAWLSKIV